MATQELIRDGRRGMNTSWRSQWLSVVAAHLGAAAVMVTAVVWLDVEAAPILPPVDVSWARTWVDDIASGEWHPRPHRPGALWPNGRRADRHLPAKLCGSPSLPIPECPSYELDVSIESYPVEPPPPEVEFPPYRGRTLDVVRVHIYSWDFWLPVWP